MKEILISSDNQFLAGVLTKKAIQIHVKEENQDFLFSYGDWISHAYKCDKSLKSVISVWIHNKLD